MNKDVKNAEENRTNKKEMSRRSFLLGSTALAATAGVLAATAIPGVAKAAELGYKVNYEKGKPGQWSMLKPEADYGGISVNYVNNNKEWLGSTQIVGEIPRLRQYDGGFNRALRNELGPKAKYGILSFDFRRYPLATGTATVQNNLVTLCEGKPAQDKLPIPDPEKMSMNIKDVAYFLNADEVGIGLTPEFAPWETMVTDKPGMIAGKPYEEVCKPNVVSAATHPYTICVSVDKHLETFLGSTGYDGIANSQSNRATMILSGIVTSIAAYIRALGYEAVASHQGKEYVIIPPVAIASGLGEQPRVPQGVAHPRLGFRHMIACVSTNLPLAPDKPIEFGAKDFCRVCKKCAQTCPAQAISYDDDEIVHNGYKRWDFNLDACIHFRAENEEGVCCAQCMKVCPWNSKEDSWFHKAGITIGASGRTSANLLVKIDDMFGYGTEVIPRFKWWLEWPELYKIKIPTNN
ncbi:reductive dehalogenase [Dehalobacter restrictus]|uniref:3-chloro-4-hydroxyphenylacetate reductive dehalogenase n=1 Tax=Dehalobacter restrictus (strain DSM 9455 / PER-K23) TaxID=871738 RepID=A0ABN4BPU7_DEHRP|nr:reductive dehalogenase [Dehalobacter restrictus]AHF09344.1 3-chloro-4-hydroxyphenylacetate reductive dehalogenase [Dehalobacter restrictus DSM 9455]